ncbi:50S ribosomal protein L3 N(5)-glutamine methyltransferase [Massilia sp. G4R7]|uniref:Ribosomal protein uL3 glutamine methyltransferase n=1 Tax=Massilia phyllostachyos TaxID=2898585 RepID=A0ABS8QC88_9BURK|nr:50S ribosomal protein L3 N(5)-glutamine methyltransferase [Massilia phyllostachyos]MCD2518617.1 50S ribosomal protein L3 N(5)-glutamine methyltransferase [Massilia phyllostachyos]
MTTTTFSTPRDLLRYAITRFNGAKLFFGHGSAEAFDEAAYLILHTLKLPLDRLDPFLDARLLPEEVIQVMEVIERRVGERVPAAYITKEAWLGEYRFYVDERVLVPRSFIAELIPQTFSPWVQDPDGVENVLELCTGSGCLAIMMAEAFPNAVVDAVDISKDALAVAEHNIREYKLEGRVNPIESDLYEHVPFKKYDLIVTNPPYVNSSSMKKLPPEYLREPQIALAGGEDGMDLVRKIVAGAAERLSPEGVLVVEIGNEVEYAEAAFGHLGLTWLSTSAGDEAVFLLTAEQLQSQ